MEYGFATFISQIRKLRHKGGQSLAQGDTAIKSQSLDEMRLWVIRNHVDYKGSQGVILR